MSRQAILGGFPFPAYISETGSRQAIAAAGAFVSETIAGAAAAPFVNPDQPNPRPAPANPSLRTHLDPLKLNLIGRDQFFGAAGQPPTYDWPVPRGAVPSIALRTWTDPLKLALLGQDKFFGAAGQAAPNTDWPVPRGAVPGIALRTFVEPTKLALLGQDRIYGAPGQVPAYEMPVPKGPAHPIALRTHLDALRLALLGKDQFFAAPGQGPANLDWPNPRGAPRALDLLTWSNGFNLPFQVPAAPPRANYDWPVPRGAAPATSLRTWLDAVRLNLLGQDRFFAAPGQGPVYDWPNPRAPAAAGALRTWLYSATLYFPAAAPFSNYDWPVPRGPAAASDLRGFALALNLKLFALPPPANYDWQNPRGAAYPLALRTFTAPLRLALLGQDTFFGPPGLAPSYDWPNPRGVPFALALRGFLTARMPVAGPVAVLHARLVAFAGARGRTASASARLRTATIPVQGMSQANDLTPPIDATVETETIGFDFGPALAAGVTISAPAVTCAAYDGQDASAPTRLVGAPSVVASKSTGAASAGVLQQIGGMVGGVTYRLTCVVTTSDGQTLSLWTHIACVVPL